MANETNAADPYEEKIEGGDTPDLFFSPDAQTIVDEPDTQGDEPETEPAGEEAPAQGKDSPEPEEPVTEPEEEPASEEEPEPETEEVEDEVPESEKKRYQYWQSEADKAKAELKEMKDQYGEVAPEVIGLAEQITKRPELLDAVENALSGKQQQQPDPTPSRRNGEQAKVEVPERPEKPQKPAGYDHFEALNNPDSESYQYLAAKEQYEDDLQDWLVAKEEAREKQAELKKKRQEQQRAQQNQMQQIVNSLRDGYGMKDTEIKEFFDVINQEPDLDDLVKYYRVQAGKTPEPADQTRAEELKARREKSKKSPPPAGTGASAAKKTANSEPEGPFTWANQ